MKANAKKLLALIMAMVMCLSLAAPAMAAGAELGTQALATQATVATVTDISWPATNTDVIDVALNYGRPESYSLGKDNLPKWIKSKVVSKALVGQLKGAVTYEVTVNTTDGYADGRADTSPLIVVVPGETGNTVKLTDTAVWDELTGAAQYYNNGQVKGYSWQEEQNDGQWRIFFKLATVKDNAFQTSKDSDWKYFDGGIFTTKRTESNMDGALAGAVEWDTTNETRLATLLADAGVTIGSSAAATTTYTYTVINPVDVDASASDSASISFGGFVGDKETGSFQVSVKATTTVSGAAPTVTYLSSVSEVEEKVKKQLGESATVESVVAATGNYFTVAVKKVAQADAFETNSSVTKSWHKGTIYWNNGSKNVAGLYDIAEKGFYNGSDKQGSDGVQIVAGTELLGPVAVKKTDVSGSEFKPVTTATLDGGTYWVFNSVAAMKAGITLQSCKTPKTVTYTQLVMNPKNDTKTNGLVNVSTSYSASAVEGDDFGYFVVTPNPNWFLPNNINVSNNKDFVKTGSWEVEAGAHINQRKVTEVTKEATCQTEGTEVTKTVCTDCGTLIASTEKVLPKISDPVETNKADDPKKPATVTEHVDKVYFDDTEVHQSNHWINKHEVKTTTNGTVTTKTTTYTCNYGYVHDELTKVETINKTDLQGAGKWNLVTWSVDYDVLPVGAATTGWPATAGNLYGNIVEIADSDIDDATLPLNRTTPADTVFRFTGATGMSDGTYTRVWTASVPVYTSNSGLPKTKTYDAVVIVKNIVNPKFDCLSGTATIEVSVYEQTSKYNAAIHDINNGGDLDSKKLAKALEDGALTLVKTESKDIVTRPNDAHRYTAGSTVCDVCGTSRESAQSKSQIITADTITVEDVTYTGTAKLPKVVVKDDAGNILIKGIDYEIGYEDENATAVGEYFVVVKGIGDYVGNRVSKTYKIVAASEPTPVTLKKQTIKTTAKNKTYKAANLKKKAASFNIKVTGAKGTLTWKTSNKKIATVKSTAKNKAKVTAVKKAKKGTAKITVKAAKTSAYKASNTLTIKVVVK